MSKLLILILSVLTLGVYAQSVNGPNSVIIGQTYEYTFNNGTIYPNSGWWAGSSSSIQRLPNIGATHRANISWNAPGSASVTFQNNYVQIGGSLSITIGVGAPNTTFSISQTCGSTTIQRNSEPPQGVLWYWQTSPSGTSTALGSATSVTLTTNASLYLRARWGTTGVWSSNSQFVGNISVNLIPPAPSTSVDAQRVSNTNVSVQLSVSSVTGATAYRWYAQSAGGTPVATTTSPSYTTTTSVSQTFWVAAVIGPCESSTRKNVQVVVYPEPAVTANNNSTISRGLPVTLSVLNHTYDTYAWLYENGQAIPGATSASFTTTKGGIYRLRVTKGTAPQFTTPVGTIVSSAETQAENFIISNTVLIDNITNEDQLASIPIGSINQSIQYFDGLGRPLQTVNVQGSPAKRDVVQPYVYDQFGREHYAYLPVVLGETSGMLKKSIVNPSGGYVGEAGNFYAANSPNDVEDDDRPWNTTIFDDSPLVQPWRSFGPGKEWFDNNRFIERNALVNTHGTASGQEQIIRWQINSNGMPVRNGYHPANTLFINTIKDEDGGIVREYRTRTGEVVLRKVYRSGDASLLNNVDVWTQTYYICDDMGSLRFVLQPELVKILAPSTANPTLAQLASLAFRYSYDQRQRMISRCVPGADSVLMVYDNRDRLVATQDGNQRAASPKEWLITKYDELNRPVLTARFVSAASRKGMQADVNAFYQNMPATRSWFETYGGNQAGYIFGYDNKSFPTLTSEAQVLTATYYDQYDAFIAPSGFGYATDNLAGQQPTPWPGVGGLITATRVRNLSDGTLLRTVNYYDAKYRLIQSVSDHQKGTLRLSQVYDFPGRVVQSKRSYIVNGTTTSVRETTAYDHASRVTELKHSVNGAADVVVASNSYNELGQLIDKKLHSTDGISFRQSVDYRYNIKGWLKNINNADISGVAPGDASHDYFGMELSYNRSVAGVNNTQAYNGNISAIQWSKGAEGAANRRAYKFDYDRTNQMLNAWHLERVGSTWLPGNNAFQESATYDLNGNIRSLTRKGFAGTLIDNLAYNYTGNRLNYIHDTGNSAAGFINGNTGTDDYGYDLNGNLTMDKNKNIASGNIRYNHLNLIQEVIKGNESIRYIYDATGRKLASENYNGTTLASRTDYIGELILENNVLKLITMPDGRIIRDGSGWEHQYFLKDHLGNVRVTFTAKPQAALTFSATFEVANQTTEQNTFNNYSSTTFDLVDHTDAGTLYQKVQYLNGGINGRVGLGKSVAVMPGDLVSVSAYGKYMNLQTTSNPNVLITSLAGAFGVSSTSTGDQLKLYNGLNSYASSVPGGNHLNDDDAAPKAFVTILFFDRDYNFLDASWDQMTTIGAQTSATVKQAPHDLLSASARAREAGYAFVFLSNEHPTFVDVYFDDVTISHTPSPIVSVSDYYPYGLQFNHSDRENALAQKYLYNSKELEPKLALNWYDYGARIYMPDIGRWNAIDPKTDVAHALTPYRYGFNNPVRFVDPNGRYETDGHYWTVYLMGTLLGLSNARQIAEYAEEPDNFMTEAGDVWKSNPTWLNPAWQSQVHSLTGGLTSEERELSTLYASTAQNERAFGYALHRLGDSYAHTRMDDPNHVYPNGVGHALSGHAPDKIANRPGLYSQYVQALHRTIKEKFNVSYTGFDFFTFDYVANSGGSTAQNSAILETEVRLQEGAKAFTVAGNQMDIIGRYVNARNAHYNQKHKVKTSYVQVDTYTKNKKGEWEKTSEMMTFVYIF